MGDKNQATKLETAKTDARYYTQNASNWCMASFVDYKKCVALLGDGECCSHFKKIYQSICPNGWVKRWEEQIENGTFPIDLPPAECVKK